MPQRRLVLSAPAKVNLYLAAGVRCADGYHGVTTILQAIGLCDLVSVETAPSLDVVTEPDLGLPPERNLAGRAALALCRRHGVEPALRITVEKRVPVGGGLGGGSSDAAAVLVGVSRLLGLPEDGLAEIAAALGADVPFFLEGGTALFGDRGDRLLRRLPSPELELAVVTPPARSDTSAVYRAYDASPEPAAPPPDALLDALRASGDPAAIGPALHNSLEAAAREVAPEVAEALASVEGLDGVTGRAVSGSGSSVFAVCRDAEAARRVVVAARERPGWEAFAVRAVGHGVEVLEEPVEG